VRPKLRIHFTTNYLKQVFEATKKYDLIIYTPHITIIRSCEGAEVTISKDGRMMIKEVSSESEARTIAGEVLKMLSKALTR
jgi:hypothetical protein